MTTTSTDILPAALEATLREVIETLAPLDRRAGSPGEEEAARWIAERLQRAGARDSRIEEEQFLDGYAPLMRGLSGAAALTGIAALNRRLRKPAAAAAAAITAAIADDVSNGPRVARHAVEQPKQTWNVVAEAGDSNAERTLVVIAHHDAAPTGFIFDDRAQAAWGELMPGIIERVDTSLPLWWALMSAPTMVAIGAMRGKRGLVRAGIAGSALATAVFADIARSPVVPGANDNLTAVALIVALAERLRDEPVEGVRVLLVSVGAEEVLQGGIYGFAARHFPSLDRDRTWFVNVDTVGSPRLIMIEGEGPVVMEDYVDRTFRDLVARAAERAGAPLRRGMRSRNSTDGIIPTRAGYPLVTLASTDRYKALSNYHKPSDTPENVNYKTVVKALTVTEAVAREIAADPWLTD
jgi:hypothetical protein